MFSVCTETQWECCGKKTVTCLCNFKGRQRDPNCTIIGKFGLFQNFIIKLSTFILKWESEGHCFSLHKGSLWWYLLCYNITQYFGSNTTWTPWRLSFFTASFASFGLKANMNWFHFICTVHCQPCSSLICWKISFVPPALIYWAEFSRESSHHPYSGKGVAREEQRSGKNNSRNGRAEIHQSTSNF